MNDTGHFPRFSLLFFSTVASPLSAQQKAPGPVTFTKVSGRIYQADGGRGAQTGFIIGDDCVLVVDAKMDKKSQDDIFAEIARLTLKPVKYLVNTHGDGDHMSGNRYFPANVTIIAHEGCRKDFFISGRDGKPSEWTKPELAPFVPAITFFDRMNIDLGGLTVELHHFGVGHTVGDAVAYIPSEKVAFTGDQASLPKAVYIHAFKGGNSFGHVKNLERMLAALDAERFITGHNGITDRKGVQSSIDAMKSFQSRIRALLKQKKSLDDIQKEFPKGDSALVEIVSKEISEGRDSVK
ncbi:MAG: MBL fold metallo-hydrolase [Candidatus Latescibacterota bacterium]